MIWYLDELLDLIGDCWWIVDDAILLGNRLFLIRIYWWNDKVGGETHNFMVIKNELKVFLKIEWLFEMLMDRKICAKFVFWFSSQCRNRPPNPRLRNPKQTFGFMSPPIYEYLLICSCENLRKYVFCKDLFLFCNFLPFVKLYKKCPKIHRFFYMVIAAIILQKWYHYGTILMEGYIENPPLVTICNCFEWLVD